MYGGATGGGKTSALLSAGLQFVDVPGYNGLLLRRTYPQLNMPESILHRAHEWLHGTDARWMAEHKRYEFPSGATLTFGYLQYDKDVYQYDGPAFQFIGFDELTSFTEWQYRFLFSRLRKLKGVDIPLRVRGATNPGGVGHVWVKDRFIKSRVTDRYFIPAKLEDNPFVDRPSYELSLAQLDPVTRIQRRFGDWDVTQEGARFKREWLIRFIDKLPGGKNYTFCRFWDLAATQGGGDFAVGTKVAIDYSEPEIYVCNVVRGQWGPHRMKEVVKATAEMDGRDVRVRMEQEPGSSGKTVVADYMQLLRGWDFKGIVSTGKKMVRWNPFAAQAEARNVVVLNGEWNEVWLEEICAVPNAENDDQADSVSGAFQSLMSEAPVFFGIESLGKKGQG